MPPAASTSFVGYRAEKHHHKPDGGLVCPPYPPLLRTACSASGSLTSSPLPAAECAVALSRLVSLLAGSLRAASPLGAPYGLYIAGLAALRSISGVRSGLRPQRAFLSASAQNCDSKAAVNPNPRARCRTSRGTTALGRRRAAGLLPSALAPEAARRTAALAPISASADGPPGSLTHLRAAAASRAAASLVMRRCSCFKAPESLLSPLL